MPGSSFFWEKPAWKSVQIRSFFWSVFSCIRTEYGDLRSKSPYSVQMQENTDQKKPRIWTLFTQKRNLDVREHGIHRFQMTCNIVKEEKIPSVFETKHSVKTNQRSSKNF